MADLIDREKLRAALKERFGDNEHYVVIEAVALLDALIDAAPPADPVEGLTAKQVEAALRKTSMPWYDEADPDYTEAVETFLAALRAASSEGQDRG